jgi:hypothetical protein
MTNVWVQEVFDSPPPFCVVRKLLTMGVARKVFLWIREGSVIYGAVILEGSIPSAPL